MAPTKRNNRKSTAALTTKAARSAKTANHSDAESSPGAPFKRSRSGCFTCRVRRKKCSEVHPTCTACTQLGIDCHWREPSWWKTSEQRAAYKELIKESIKQTRSDRKPKKATPFIDSSYAALQLPHYNYSYDSYNHFGASDRYISPDANLQLDLNFDYTNNQSYNLVNNNINVNSNNVNDHLSTYGFNFHSVDLLQVPYLTPDATPGYESFETPEDLVHDSFDDFDTNPLALATTGDSSRLQYGQEPWEDVTCHQNTSYKTSYTQIPDAEVEGCLFNPGDQTDFQMMPVVDTQQFVYPGDCHLTVPDAYQHGEYIGSWSWASGMELEGNPHNLPLV